MVDDNLLIQPPTQVKKEVSNHYVYLYEQLEWRTTYKDPDRFTEADYRTVYSLFNEISHQDAVSDILIIPFQPVLIKRKRGGLFSITKRHLDLREAEDLVKVVSNNPNIISEVRNKHTVSGAAMLLENDVIDLHNATELVEYQYQEKTRYRYELVGASTLESDVGFSMILRPLPNKPLSVKELKVPRNLLELFLVKDGLCIIGGATGEGKTTLLAAINRYILENDTVIKGNIITHEEPIEITYHAIRSKHSYITQSGIGQHITDFAVANRSAMRRSPDLILVGELRDGETIDAAIELSTTGHPVYATTHANSVAEIFPRLLSRFPLSAKATKCYDLIRNTRVLASQKLIWTAGPDKKLMAVREYLPFTPQLRTYLSKFAEDPDTVIRKISGIMEQGLFGVESYQKQGERLLAEGIITPETFNHLVDRQINYANDVLEKLEAI